jgi:hypothetical protein
MLLFAGAALVASAFADPPTAPNIVPSTPTPTEVRIAVESPAAARIRATTTLTPPPAPPPFDPLADVGMDLEIRNRQFQKFTLKLPDDLRFEIGNLAVVPRNDLVTTSPYFNMRKDFYSYGGALDRSLQLQLGAVNLGARLFSNDAPVLDAQIDSALQDVNTVSNYFGISREKVQWLQQHLAVDTSYQQQWLVISSALGQVGRTFRLYGPVDLGLVAGGLARWEGYFPNMVLDQSAALRFHTPTFSSALIGGVSEGLGLPYQTFWQDTISAESPKWTIHPEFAPHVGPEMWGAVPGVPGAKWDAGASWTFNPVTTRTEMHAGVLIPTKPVDIGVTGRYEFERGPQIEFDRRRGGGEITIRPFGLPFQIFGGYSQESIQFGDASLNNQMGMIGIRGGDLSPGAPGQSKTLTVEESFGGVDTYHINPETKLGILQQAHHYADLADALYKMYHNQVFLGWAEIQGLWSGLNPDIKAILQDWVKQKAPGLPPLNEIFGTDITKVPYDSIGRLALLLTDQDIYERVLVRFARHEILDYLNNKGVDLPVLGNVKFTAPVVLAAANAFSLGFTPLIPMTEKDARNALDPYLLKQLEKQTGVCGDQTNAQGFVNCVVGKLPPDAAAALQKEFGNALGSALQQAIAWHSDFIRHEINQELLQVFVAAETLDEMTVDRGVPIGDLDRDWLIKAFERRDMQRNERMHGVVKAIESDLKAELRAEEADLRDKLANYGRAELADLQAQAAKRGVRFAVAEGDWPALFAHYREHLVGFMSNVIERAEPGSRMTITMHAMPDMGVMTFKEKDGLTIKLPPVAQGRNPQRVLQDALEMLPLPCKVLPAVPPPLVPRY